MDVNNRNDMRSNNYTGEPRPAYDANNNRAGCVLFVGNLPYRTPWQVLKDHFQTVGKVRYADLIADREGNPRGSAIVTMETQQDAENAIAALHNSLFEERRLIVRLLQSGPRPPLVMKERLPPYRRTEQFDHHVNPHSGNSLGANSNMAGNGAIPSVPRPRSQQGDERGRRLFISNLPYDCSKEQLRETFQQVGTVVRTEVFLSNGKPRGLGIVVMETAEDAQKAIDEFNDIEMAGRPMSVRLDNKC